MTISKNKSIIFSISLILTLTNFVIITAQTTTKTFATPSDFGVTNTQYRIAESNYFFKRSLAKAPINTWAHQDNISIVKTQQVIRENQDILYSSAVVDVSKE